MAKRLPGAFARSRMPLALLALLASAGCAMQDGPRVITVQGSDYSTAFDAAMSVALSHGLRPVVADRATGVIETKERAAGSLVEPWRTDNGGLANTLGHTVNFERRRMRVEFVPADLDLPMPDSSKPVAAAALPGSDRAEDRFDLLHHDGPVEMRAWVYVERDFRPNERIGDWSRVQTRYSLDPLDRQDALDSTTTLRGTWTPIGRDEAYERTVMTEIQKLLQAPPPQPAAETPRTQR